MAIDPHRRRLLHALPGAAALGLMPGILWAGTQDARQAAAVLTCWSDSAQRPRSFHAGLSDAFERALPLPARGHEVQWHPRRAGSAIVVARRPGSFLVHWRVADGEVLAHYEAEDDLRFEGHFVFDATGQRVLATETDLITGEGQIGVYDADTLERIDVWPTQGIGPHAVALLRNGTLAVANGGILTLPETGRVKRNLDTMDPALVLLDANNGVPLEQFRLPDHQMSVRHIAQAQDGTVGVALQNEGRELHSLFAYLNRGQLRYGNANTDVLDACGTYTGDIAALGDHFAVSCTTAGVTAIWDSKGNAIAQLPTPRVCALTPMNEEWFASADSGNQWQLQADAHLGTPAHTDVAWDNHAVASTTAQS